MSEIYVTPDGLDRPTLAELKAQIEDEYKTRFGNDIDLDPDSVFGQFVGITSQAAANWWEGVEEIYTSRDPDSATGISLDFIARETGTTRLAATPTRIDDVFLYGAQGTIVLAGKQVHRTVGVDTDPANPELFSLESNVTITQTAARDLYVTPAILGSIVVYVITITNGTPIGGVVVVSETLNYTSGAGDDANAIVNALIADASGPAAGMFSNVDGQLRTLSETDFGATFGADLNLTILGSAGDFVADNAGVITVPANSLTVISTPVAGWDSVNNIAAGTTGITEESDEALRLRRERNLIQGKATEEAIRAALELVDAVAFVGVTSNRTLITDSEGRPAKSFEAVVSGGSDADIAQSIWENQPAGIESFGSEVVIITDSQGNLQTVKFNRPVPLYIFVKVLRNFNTEETYPSNGDDLIKQAIVDWAENNLQIGDDVIRQRLSIPVYTVSGIADIEITLDADLSPLHTPVYAAVNITVVSRQLATFDIANIMVAVLP